MTTLIESIRDMIPGERYEITMEHPMDGWDDPPDLRMYNGTYNFVELREIDNDPDYEYARVSREDGRQLDLVDLPGVGRGGLTTGIKVSNNRPYLFRDDDGTYIMENPNATWYYCRVLSSSDRILTREQIARERIQQQRQQQLNTQQQAINAAKQYAAENPIQQSPYDECVLCSELLNNLDGPGSSSNCQSNCNDVVSMCEHNHRCHRGCILNWCGASQVDVLGQMNASEFGVNMRRQQGSDKCPICRQEINCSELITKPKVPDEELKVNVGGRRKRKTRKYKCKKHRTNKRRTHKRRTHKRRTHKNRTY